MAHSKFSTGIYLVTVHVARGKTYKERRLLIRKFRLLCAWNPHFLAGTQHRRGAIPVSQGSGKSDFLSLPSRSVCARLHSFKGVTTNQHNETACARLAFIPFIEIFLLTRKLRSHDNTMIFLLFRKTPRKVKTIFVYLRGGGSNK